MRQLLKKFLESPLITGGGLILIICVVLEIHGSSINIYADAFGYPELNGEIFGRYRTIRSDEYNIFTPLAFSQYFTNFSMISDIVRAAPTNMFIVYGQAVLHPAIIFRPAQIGYFFLDQGSALAFFWMGRLIALFIVSFKFAEKILHVDKKLSSLYAVMVAFSPLAQWWWSVNSIAEILAAGQGVVLCWKIYLENGNKSTRFFSAILFLWCAGIFIFGIYPAWQVSFGYVFLFLLIAVSLENSKSLKFLWRDKIFWLTGFLIMIAPIVHALYISQDMIQAQMATEYPGQRFNLGGDWSPLWSLTYSISSLLPFVEVVEPITIYGINALTNNCEVSSFFCMTPLGIILFLYLNFKLKRRDFIMSALVVIIILLMIWSAFFMPEAVAKFTLMSKTTPWRVKVAIDFAEMILLFRGLALVNISELKIFRIVTATLISVISLLAIYHFFPQWLDFTKAAIIFTFLAASVIFITSRPTKIKTAVLILMMLTIGATINPLAKGVDCIFGIPAGQKISEIARQDKSAWLAIQAPENFSIMFGAPTIDCTNIYPVLERWKKLDADGENFKIYNRYANIQMTLQNAPTKFVLTSVDCLRIDLNVDDLPKLEAKYIFSSNSELENFSTASIKIRKIYADRNAFIYEIAN